MKFLCMTCDEALQHKGTRGPDAGVMTIMFACPGCNWEMAMYTNPWETQTVRSLDVKIGGRSVPPEPMEMLRSSLGRGRDAMPTPVPVSDDAGPSGEAPKCPFADVVAQAYNEAVEAIPAPAASAAANDALVWTAEAEQRVAERIPSFVRSMARMGIEKYARERGYREITSAVLDEAKEIFMG
jgi:hypothetical protein